MSTIRLLNFAQKIFAAFLIFNASGLLFTQTAQAADPKDFWFYIINDRDSQLKELLRSGMDPNRKSPNQQTPLTMAARENSWRAFDVLLASPKIDVNLPNAYNETPLMYTALLGDLPRSQALLAKGAKVNQPGWSALHYAAVKGQSKIVSLLLSKGALLNEPSPDGDTPLILAVRAGDVDTVQALVRAGADPMLSNFKAQNAIETARAEGRRSLAEALEKVVASRKTQP
ncbi:ankyrin repeat domain-containing protein [Zwartia panacis]|uniref:ankyrin repeat domain-containing protein n=1 Tax=Zwartia panacis TaxID=2683345 RepID=UPI0025B4763B|nr:ankyrin repeat domain-containing protein [Zwartia panacis]MDN4016790.1 ankyrin repeat domain-containing protein [Zwartia panacis]